MASPVAHGHTAATGCAGGTGGGNGVIALAVGDDVSAGAAASQATFTLGVHSAPPPGSYAGSPPNVHVASIQAQRQHESSTAPSRVRTSGGARGDGGALVILPTAAGGSDTAGASSPSASQPTPRRRSQRAHVPGPGVAASSAAAAQAAPLWQPAIDLALLRPIDAFAGAADAAGNGDLDATTRVVRVYGPNGWMTCRLPVQAGSAGPYGTDPSIAMPATRGGSSTTRAVRTNKLQCRYCPHVATRKDHLVDHERTHGAQKRYFCGYCPYAAIASSGAAFHIFFVVVNRQ